MSLNSNQNQQTYKLNNISIVQISGPDTNKLLQGQITTNIETIEEGLLALSAICNPQGRCVSLFFISKNKENIYLFLHKDTIEDTIANLKKYGVFYKVEIIDCSEQFDLIAFADCNVKEISEQSELVCAKWPEQNIALCMQPIDQSASSKSALNDSSLNTDYASEEDWLHHLALKGVPWLTNGSQSEYLPHNINLPKLKAVDFKKGCFTGQEVIARMQYKGKLKSHMQLFKSLELIDCQPMDKIYSSEKAAAQVICTAQDQNNETAILALVKDRFLEDKKFTLGSENGPILKLIKSTDEK